MEPPRLESGSFINRIAEGFVHIGSTQRDGFETKLVIDGTWHYVYAEAISANGSVLRRTQTEETEGFTATEPNVAVVSGVRTLRVTENTSLTISASISLGMLLSFLSMIGFRYFFGARKTDKAQDDAEDQVSLLPIGSEK